MISCVIIEDEIAGQTILKNKLAELYPNIKVVEIIDNYDDAVDFVSKNEIDILFIDIHIKGGLGLDIIKLENTINSKKIFVTAHEQYAISALNNGADYYLLKPIRTNELKTGVDIILEKLQSENEVDIIVIPQNNSLIPIEINEIIYLQSEGSYTHIYTKGSKILSSKNLGHFEQLLPANRFIRTHHSYIVNNKKIERIKKGRTGILTMSNQYEVPVSQRRLKDFLEFFEQ